MTSSAGASGLILAGSPPSSATASRIVARSTTQGTPVKSCMMTRAGVNWISVSGSAFASHAADRADVVGGDVGAVLGAQEVLEQHLEAVGQGLAALDRREAVDLVGLLTHLERAVGVEAVRAGHRGSLQVVRHRAIPVIYLDVKISNHTGSVPVEPMPRACRPARLSGPRGQAGDEARDALDVVRHRGRRRRPAGRPGGTRRRPGRPCRGPGPRGRRRRRRRPGGAGRRPPRRRPGRRRCAGGRGRRRRRSSAAGPSATACVAGSPAASRCPGGTAEPRRRRRRPGP